MLVVLGGSSPWTVELIERLEPDDALLVGQNVRLLSAMRRFLLSRSRCRVETSTDPNEALRRATVVLCQVRIGGWPGRRIDESAPLQWGAYGDETLGVGGLRAASRASSVLAEWARSAGDVPAVMLTNPTDLLTRWWRLHSGGPVVSVCEAPTEMLDRLPCGTRYLGVNHLGWALTPSGRRVPSRWLGVAENLARAIRDQRAKPRERADELVALTRSLESTITGENHGHFDRLITRRNLSWYRTIVVPVLRALLRGDHFLGVIGMPNEGRLPGLPGDIIVEGHATIEASEQAPAALVDGVARLAESRQRAWEVLVGPTTERLARFTSSDPFSTGAKYPPDLLSWIVAG